MNHLTVSEIAEMTGGLLEGPGNILITGLNRIEYAGQGEITFLSDAKFLESAVASPASCIITNKNFDLKPNDKKAIIRVDNAYETFISLLKKIDPNDFKFLKGIHPNAVVDKSAMISDKAFIGPGCVIGPGCRIGPASYLTANITLYRNVEIGSNSAIHAGAVLCSETKIGDNCIIHPGVVIGADGFGFSENKEDGSFEKIPQLGNVVIGDNVEIGSNCTIDRAIAGSTIIRNGVKMDNLVHIAHNVIIGENSAVVAQAGISGSTKIGDRNRIAGQAGLVGHIETADDVIITAQSGVSKSITKKGTYFGSPIKEIKRAFKIEAVIRNLPELQQEILELKKEIEKLKKNRH